MTIIDGQETYKIHTSKSKCILFQNENEIQKHQFLLVEIETHREKKRNRITQTKQTILTDLASRKPSQNHKL